MMHLNLCVLMKEEEDVLIDFLLALRSSVEEEEEQEEEVAGEDMVEVEGGTAAVTDIWRKVEDEKIRISIWQPT
ncbi:hypothetical protein FXO37_29119 [Capsicum annuum]|nr:hypothetical protein FXO37_29119 [Capsicum annuum]